jgi:Na+/H+ antiporter NhaD/arsenite permease-like protein
MPLTHNPVKLLDKNLAKLTRASLFLLITLITLKITLVNWHIPIRIELSHIALIPALLPTMFSATRFQLLKSVHRSALLFFAAMFVLVASICQTGFMRQ